MSSATTYDPRGGRMASEIGKQFMERNTNLGMTPRQRELNRLWGWFCCVNYESRQADWNGCRITDEVETEAIATSAIIPPGFYDFQSLPIKFRRPTAPYRLPRVIVKRFTGMLFSERRTPVVHVQGDPDTESFVEGLIDASRLWANMLQARDFGGAMGSVAVGFAFIDGRPEIDVFDPRWSFPQFRDRRHLTLERFEYKYQFPEEERNAETEKWETVWYWYRRVIDENADTLYRSIPVGNGDEPPWDDPAMAERMIDQRVEHSFGFCPVVWIQNTPVGDALDGEPDCHGIFEMIQAVDADVAQGQKGVLATCDPTMVIDSDAQLSEIKTGSDNCIKLPRGSGAKFLEASGQGAKTAMEYAQQLRKWALEVAQCVLDHPDGVKRTATEIERVYESMISKADTFREQYGQHGVLPLLEMMVKAARKLFRPTLSEEGQPIVKMLDLPQRATKREEAGQEIIEHVARKLGPGGTLQLAWPGYFQHTLEDANSAAQAVGQAKLAGVLDDEHAVKFAAPFFDVDDTAAMAKKLATQKQEQQQALEQQMMAGLQPGGEF